MSGQSQHIEQHLGEDACVLMEAGMWQSKTVRDFLYITVIKPNVATDEKRSLEYNVKNTILF